MARQKQAKVLLFDIGGVCVVSPFQTILDYELRLNIPPGWVNYSISKTAPNGWWQKVERGTVPLDATFYAGFTRDLHDAERWQAFYQEARQRSLGTANELPAATPPVPEIDGQQLFDDMMEASSGPDPWMYPALQALHDSGRFILAALSNTVIFPSGHRQHEADFFQHPVRRLFDVFISSAHVGMRKPDLEIYELALREVDAYARKHANTPRGQANHWHDGVRPEDVVFFDDIGANLKPAKQFGFRTVKVNLGRTYEAVDTLEAITGLRLAGTHPRPPKPWQPSGPAKARI